jgi:hypothetical protein
MIPSRVTPLRYEDYAKICLGSYASSYSIFRQRLISGRYAFDGTFRLESLHMAFAVPLQFSWPLLSPSGFYARPYLSF